MPRQMCDALIVGAGPTGLVLGLWLGRLGVKARIVDRASEPGQTSRAVGVQARTLEFYRQIGLADKVVRAGLPFAAANIWVGGRHEGRVPFGAMGQGLSPYPYMLVYPQDEHEKLLVEELANAGVGVERPVELVDLKVEEDRVISHLKGANGQIEVVESRYLAGCDGAKSFVRERLGMQFSGGTYAHVFYVADVEASGPSMNGELHLALDDGDFLASFPLKATTRARLIGAVRDDDSQREGREPGWESIHKRVIERIKLVVERVNWFSTYRVHHRVASSFRVGRAFLVGDAGHIHSPVGGQGMNTGIGDAVNLSWKLAAVLQGKADPSLLDSYEEERIPFARRLVRTTDRAFAFVTAGGALATQLRVRVAPPILTTLARLPGVRRLMFDTVSQIRIRYRGSSLSEGTGGRVRGGDRLPWVVHRDGGDNFEPMTALTWHVHVYGSAEPALVEGCGHLGFRLCVFPWSEAADKAGLARDAVYLVRPDGYVALATDRAEAVARIEAYSARHGLRLGVA